MVGSGSPSRLNAKHFPSFLPLAYHTVILDGTLPISAFCRLVNSPETAYSFRPSLVIRLAVFIRTTASKLANAEILQVLNRCTSIKELHLRSWHTDLLPVLGRLPPGLQPFCLSIPLALRAVLTSLVSSGHTSNLTHLEVFETSFPPPSIPPHIPTLTHLVVMTYNPHNIFSAAGLMQRVNATIAYIPRSVTVLGIVFADSSLDSFLFEGTVRTILEMGSPTVVLGTFDPISKPIDERITSTVFINGTKHLNWGAKR